MSIPEDPSTRAVLDDVLSPQKCAELISLARALSVRGYRPGVASATIYEVATAAPHLLLPLVAARERIREVVETALDLPLGLLVEFTGLISWRTGAEIGFHADDCQPYLKQREWSAVCYLNTAGSDFGGGAFRFQQGRPAAVQPAAGRLVAYAAREQHAVEPVSWGERFTLTLWLTTRPEANEDTKLLAQLEGSLQSPPLGLPAAMYELPEGPTDLRLCRLGCMGFGVSDCDGLRLGIPLQEMGAPEPLQLVVHAGIHARWLGEQLEAGQLQQHMCPVLSTGLEFGSVGEAALFVSWYARRCCPAARASWEPVCRRHLRVGITGTSNEHVCIWGEGRPASPAEGSWGAQLCRELRAACKEWRSEMAASQQQFMEQAAEWHRVGALF